MSDDNRSIWKRLREDRAAAEASFTPEERARFERYGNVVSHDDDNDGSREVITLTPAEVWARKEENRRRIAGELPYKVSPSDYPYKAARPNRPASPLYSAPSRGWERER